MAHSTTAAERRRLGIPEVDTRPRPFRQSLWILGSVVAAGLAVLSAGDQLNQTGAAATAGLEGADLIELADNRAAEPGTGGSAPVPGSPTTWPASAVGGSELPAHERVGRDALAGISYPWQQLLGEWTIEFEPSTDGLYGLTLVPERTIEIYVRPDQSPSMVSHVIAHELGHAIDVTLNDGPDRRRWSEARGLSSAPWWPESGANDFMTGAGDFAESFAAWQTGPTGFRSELGPPPDAAQIALLAELSAR